MTLKPDQTESVVIPATDGFPLRAQMWTQAGTRAVGGAVPAPAVIINPATSVHSRYYGRFAAFLHAHGFNVICYDYRGIGGSRPAHPRAGFRASLRGFQASWLDWGSKDFEGVLRFAHERFNGHDIHVAAHSVGGFLIGMAPSNHRIQRVFTMGAQFAYWRDYAASKRLSMMLRWHLFMPAMTALFGYFPGKRLGWLEDTPRGVVRDWTTPRPDIEGMYRSGPQALPEDALQELIASFGCLTGPTLALSIGDDEFGTIAAIHRLLRYYRNSPSIHLRLDPAALGQPAIGHFAFFHARYADSLWRIPLAWLRDGAVTDEIPAQRIPIPMGQLQSKELFTDSARQRADG